MRLRAGDLVTVTDLADVVDLYSQPPAPVMSESNGSMLVRGEVALVVALDRTDGRVAYIIGPRGGGWTFGAFLRVV